ncbi:hypothetical protein JW948_11575 [bacterium]|nr:hypothetical protein [bacterium]
MQIRFLTRLLIVSIWGILTYSLTAGVALYKHIDLSANSVENCRMTVGDLNGDNLVDYVFNDGRRVIKAFDHNGALLWQKFNPNDPGVTEQSHNFTISLYDIDLDNKEEVICYLEINGENALAIVDGVTGNIQTSVVVPFDSPRDHEFFGLDNVKMQDHVAIANLRGLAVPQDILAIHASKMKVAAYHYIDGQLVRQWYWVTDSNGYSSGHYAFPYDIDDDGRDEVIAGVDILDENCNLLWNLPILPFDPAHPDWGLDHVDAAACADIDPDHPGKEILFVAMVGIWMMDPDGNVLWFKPSKVTDPVNGLFPGEGIQELVVGNFRTDVPGLEAVIYAEGMYDANNVAIFDRAGNVLKWGSQVQGPRRWITCAMDWDGDRSVDEIYSRLGIFNGQFTKISESVNWSYMQSADFDEFPPVVCDVRGDQREEIIWYDTNELFIMYNPAALVGEVKPSPWENIKYRMRYANLNHCSPMYFDWTAMDEVPDTTPPNTPVQLNSIERTASSVTLSWQPPPAAPDGDIADCYCIYRDGQLIQSVTETRFTDQGLTGETNYQYALYAMDEVPNTCVSPAVLTVQTLDGIPPNPPSNLQSLYQTESEISLQWTAPGPASDGDPAASYRILRNGSQIATVTVTQYLDHDLSPDAAYTYQIYSLDHNGVQSQSAAVKTFNTLDIPQPNVVLRELNAVVLTSPPVRLSNGMKTMSFQLTTTAPVSELPPPITMVESDGSMTQIPVTGSVPGTQFTGTLIIDSSIAHGEATLLLQEGSLMDSNGNPCSSSILTGSTVFMDQQAPVRPQALSIISSR